MLVVNVPALTGETGLLIGVSLVGGRGTGTSILLKVAEILGDVLVKEGGWVNRMGGR